VFITTETFSSLQSVYIITNFNLYLTDMAFRAYDKYQTRNVIYGIIILIIITRNTNCTALCGVSYCYSRRHM